MSAPAAQAAQAELPTLPLVEWRADPVRFVREVFRAEPDAWQQEVLHAFAQHQRIAMCASKGPGKSTVLAWLIWLVMLCYLHPKIACTSISEANLRDGLWTELAKWLGRSELLQFFFDFQKTRIINKQFPDTWFVSARTWSRSSDQNTQAQVLAGLHADNIMFVIDESGGIPDAVMAAAEAALSTCTFGRIIQAGNPIMLEGPLYRAVKLEPDHWYVVRINGDPDNPKRSPRIDPQWARDQINRYGRENPWVRVNVFGDFPETSLNALIGAEEVREAMHRSYRESDIAHAAKILGVDVARFGADQSILFPRQGLVALTPFAYRNLDTQAGISVVNHRWEEWQPDAVFIDSTGGYGAGWVDGLRALGRSPFEVQFSGRPNDPRFYNKRAEMWFGMCQWVKDGGQLPVVEELIPELSGIQYSFRGDKLLLEDKDQFKARIGRSCDHADALCMTFCQSVARRSKTGRSRHQADYDPFKDAFELPTGR